MEYIYWNKFLNVQFQKKSGILWKVLRVFRKHLRIKEVLLKKNILVIFRHTNETKLLEYRLKYSIFSKSRNSCR